MKKIKVVNAGKCMICGKPIKLVVPIDCRKSLNRCFCRKCDPELKEPLLKDLEREEER